MRRITKRFATAVAVLGLMVGGGGRAMAGLVVIPNSNATIEGDNDSAFPFNLAPRDLRLVLGPWCRVSLGRTHGVGNWCGGLPDRLRADPGTGHPEPKDRSSLIAGYESSCRAAALGTG